MCAIGFISPWKWCHETPHQTQDPDAPRATMTCGCSLRFPWSLGLAHATLWKSKGPSSRTGRNSREQICCVPVWHDLRKETVPQDTPPGSISRRAGDRDDMRLPSGIFRMASSDCLWLPLVVLWCLFGLPWDPLGPNFLFSGRWTTSLRANVPESS
jgi:hypothetical protein